LRSDTVTRPTPAMRRAMAEAEVGDDVHADDPTVRTLEEETAGLLGMEAALFVPSGSMGNGIAVEVHTKPGDTIVLDPHAHLVTVESRAVVDLLGRRFHTVEGNRGRLEAGRVGASLDAGGVRAALFEAENTFNWHNGALYEPEALRALGEEARSRRARFHLDGARLWNASVATGLPLAAYAACADSVMVCYSKGLGAPIGSALDKHMVVDPVRRIGRLAVHFEMPAGIPESAQGPLERAAHTCPVHQSLHPEVHLDTTFHWAV
jgi:threonine aldolase